LPLDRQHTTGLTDELAVRRPVRLSRSARSGPPGAGRATPGLPRRARCADGYSRSPLVGSARRMARYEAPREHLADSGWTARHRGPERYLHPTLSFVRRRCAPTATTMDRQAQAGVVAWADLGRALSRCGQA